MASLEAAARSIVVSAMNDPDEVPRHRRFYYAYTNTMVSWNKGQSEIRARKWND